MRAFMKMRQAFRQQASQIIPPATPAERKRTWSASFPQNDQWRFRHWSVSGSGRRAATECAIVPSFDAHASSAILA
jgi:DNA-binding IclR family transcriptional regulator